MRECFKTKKCPDCKIIIASNRNDCHLVSAEFTKTFDMGGLMYPSTSLFVLILKIENAFTECLSVQALHQECIEDVITALEQKYIKPIGCEKHKITLTKRLINFFVITRMHFYLKQINVNSSTKR